MAEGWNCIIGISHFGIICRDDSSKASIKVLMIIVFTTQVQFNIKNLEVLHSKHSVMMIFVKNLKNF